MDAIRSAEYLQGLIQELIKQPAETSWLEFKVNNTNPDEIGKNVSSLSNSAALDGKANAYLVWGVENETHAVVGTTFKPTLAKKGNEDLINWLTRLLEPRLYLRFYEIDLDGRNVVLLEIPRASGKPVRFSGVEYINIGSYSKPLKDHPKVEQALWLVFQSSPYEEQIAWERASEAEVIALLDCQKYFELLGLPIPTDAGSIMDRLDQDRMIAPCAAGGWDIQNLGAILFAKQLKSFKGLERKAVRLIIYKGRDRLQTVRELPGARGYAAGFEELIDYINMILPRNEVIGRALRTEVPMFPELAIRELVANALIHQDFGITGAGPMIEIFDDRMEITNPGIPLVKTERFLDSPPRSRNDALASFMRRVRICEERGSGIDKVVFQTELHQLPAPVFETGDGFTRAILFAHKPLRKMDKADKVRACYLHACLRYVGREEMTNTSLRDRFGIAQRNLATASRIIRDTMDDGLIKPHAPDQGKRHAKYVPFWA